MRSFNRILISTLAVAALARPALAEEVTARTQVEDRARVEFDFSDLASKKDQQLGAESQPYELDGITFPDLFVVEPSPALGGSGGLALRSAGIGPGNANLVTIEFADARSAVAMNYRDERATSIVFTALDEKGATIETFTRSGGAGYGGFRFTEAKMRKVTLSAPHASAGDADASRLFIDDVIVSLDADQGGKTSGGCAHAELAWTGVLGLAALLRRRRA